LIPKGDGCPFRDSVGIIVVEKLFEVLGLLTIVAPLPFLLALPHGADRGIRVIAIGGLIALAVAVFLARSAESSKGTLGQLARGLACMRNPSHVALAVMWSVAAYLVDATEIWLVLRALSINVPWATPALVLLGANLAIAIPSTPGQFGALEAGVVAVLAIVHVPTAQALAFALVYHVMQLLPIVLVGLSGVRMMAEVRHVPSPPEPVEVVS
jgi:hypothetical protein